MEEGRKAKARRYRLRRAYGLTPEQYSHMLFRQSGGCQICGRKPKKYRLHVDHDHRTGRVRGLLCMRCNHRLLGRGLEDPALHEAAANYLRSTFDGRTLPGVSVVDEPFIPPLEPTITARRRARGPR